MRILYPVFRLKLGRRGGRRGGGRGRIASAASTTLVVLVLVGLLGALARRIRRGSSFHNFGSEWRGRDSRISLVGSSPVKSSLDRLGQSMRQRRRNSIAYLTMTIDSRTIETKVVRKTLRTSTLTNRDHSMLFWMKNPLKVEERTK
jgi:hypothetical protein